MGRDGQNHQTTTVFAVIGHEYHETCVEVNGVFLQEKVGGS
jgi:hypothetical protein